MFVLLCGAPEHTGARTGVCLVSIYASVEDCNGARVLDDRHQLINFIKYIQKNMFKKIKIFIFITLIHHNR